MINFENLKAACGETKTLANLSGYETQIAYDPAEHKLYAETNTIGSQIVYSAPIVTLGFVRSPMTMRELAAWAEERIEERNAENRWY